MSKLHKCYLCKKRLPSESFYKDKSRLPDLVSSACRSCKIESNRLRDPRKKKNVFIKTLYGITMDQYDVMMAEQNGVCKICLQPCKSGMHLAVDHCHKTGKVRGLLCSQCNRSLGGFRDDLNILIRAIKYLGNNHDV